MNAAATSRSLPSRQHTPRTARTLSASALAALALAAPGCFAPQNDTNTIGGSTTLSTLSPDTPTGIRTASTATPDAPSLPTNSFSRDHWAVARFSVPLDAPAHQPTYASAQGDATSELVRQRGENPTADSAMDLSTRRSAGQEIAEGFTAPLWAAFDLGLMPARMLLASPFSSDHATDRTAVGRERVPQGWITSLDTPPQPAPVQGSPAPASGASPEALGGSPATPPAAGQSAAPAQVHGRAASVPHAVPPAAPLPPIAPAAVPTGYWVFRDGQWTQGEKPATPAPGAAPSPPPPADAPKP